MLTILAADAAAATAGTPWWGVPVIAGGFTVFGVGLAQLGTYLADRRKTAREDAQRWDKDTREACARLCREVSVSFQKIIDGRTEESPWPPAEVDDEAVLQHWFEVQLIAPPRVVEAGHAMLEWYNAVAVGYHPKIGMDKQLLQGLSAARFTYLDAVRAQYGLQDLPDYMENQRLASLLKGHGWLYFSATLPKPPDTGSAGTEKQAE